ncbi:ABC transporter substrate-binding protein [Geodermatophilus ruber]|uniref:NitT/TauT family transport system substrate-binding protein n=1 Tax=Geodermatophilus ruber TaxID=504800 RepID=A0A1I4GPA2_9ACTN|nr:ABC transporter substrate-binding protein [Geodermatophilus ruber]SFL31739.1 NitT/TauT family transport system substrate-binding protein [Geodermatophilus ruber]
MSRLRLTVLLSCSVLLAACGGSGDGEPTGAGSSGSPRSVTVGVIPIADVAPLHLGVEQGFFEDRGLDVELVPGQGGAALIPAVVSGEQDFAFSNTLSLMVAQEAGLPIRVVAPGNASTGDPEDDFACVLVPAGSPLQSLADLPGTRVSTNTLNNINVAVIRDLVDRAGADSSAIEFLEIAHPDVPQAVGSGQVDAAVAVEPFKTIALQQGGRCLSSVFAEAQDDPLLIGAYFTTAETAQSDPELVDAFVEGLRESFAYATENPDEARRILGTYTQLSPELTEAITLTGWPQDLETGSFEYMSEIGARYGSLTEPADLDALLPAA